MWAAIGLGEIFSPEVEQEFIGTLIHPTGSQLGLGTLAIFFLLPALVVLPVWWHRQGRRWFAFWRERRGGPER
jgi:hypothetical protein